MELRLYQKEIAVKAFDLLNTKGIVYLVMEVRTGKTLTALHAADLYGAKKVLFLTKKKAIKSITDDYSALKPSFHLTVINNESMHTVTDNDFDLLISDEHHRNSAFAKPNKSAKAIRERFGHLPHIYLSGTPAIESGSQWFFSFWTSNRSPFKNYRNFYDWAKTYTEPKIKHFGALQVRDYSCSIDDKIMPIVEPYLIRFSQEQAGFKTTITENVIYHPLNVLCESLIKRLMSDLVIEGKEQTIFADTPVKLMSKVHQLEGGSIIFESNESRILSDDKAQFIRDKFQGKKLAIFYFFKKEYEILKSVFGDSLTDDLNEFNKTDKHIALQQVSASEGISLKAADALVYYSFGYSGKFYTQGRDRLTVMDREENNVYFVFAKGSLSEKIYKSIKSKKRYNEKLFIREFRSVINNQIS